MLGSQNNATNISVFAYPSNLWSITDSLILSASQDDTIEWSDRSLLINYSITCNILLLISATKGNYGALCNIEISCNCKLWHTFQSRHCGVALTIIQSPYFSNCSIIEMHRNQISIPLVFDILLVRESNKLGTYNNWELQRLIALLLRFFCDQYTYRHNFSEWIYLKVFVTRRDTHSSN